VFESTISPLDDTRRLERVVAEALEAIPGVLAAAVWLNGPAEVREAFVTAAPGASISAIRTTAADVISAQGVVVPAEVLHVALLEPSAMPPTLQNGRYLLLDSIETRRASNFVTCRVRLQRRGRSRTAEAQELDTEQGRARAAARATLDAAQHVTSGIRLALEGVQLLEVFGRRYVVLSVEAAFARRFSHLPGIALFDRSIEDAACLAALDAIERWVAW